MLLGRVRVGGRLVVTKRRRRSGCNGRTEAGSGGRRRRNLGRQGMGSQAHLHQRLGVRQAGNSEAVPYLVTLHRLTGSFVPLAGRFLVKFSSLNQRSLDFLHALRLGSNNRTPDFISGMRILIRLCCPWLRSTMTRAPSSAFGFAFGRTVFGFVASVFDGTFRRSWWVHFHGPGARPQSRSG